MYPFCNAEFCFCMYPDYEFCDPFLIASCMLHRPSFNAILSIAVIYFFFFCIFSSSTISFYLTFYHPCPSLCLSSALGTSLPATPFCSSHATHSSVSLALPHYFHPTSFSPFTSPSHFPVQSGLPKVPLHFWWMNVLASFLVHEAVHDSIVPGTVLAGAAR